MSFNPLLFNLGGGGTAAALPTVTSVVGSARHGESLVISGTNLGSAAVAVRFTGPLGNTVSVAQSLGANTSTSITISALDVEDVLPLGSVELRITTSAGVVDTTLQLVPAVGTAWRYTDVPWNPADESVFEGASPAVQDGWQVQYDTTTQEGDPVTVFADGTFLISDSDPSTQHFFVRVFDMQQLLWSDWTEIAVFEGVLADSAVTLQPVSADTALTVSGDPVYQPVFIGPAFDPITVERFDTIPSIDVGARFERPFGTLSISVQGGVLPAGLTLLDGVLAGRAEAAGEFELIFVATDQLGATAVSTPLSLIVIRRVVTWRDVLTRALQKAGAVALGNTPSAELIESALLLLIDMLEAWRDEGLDLGVVGDEIRVGDRCSADAGARRAIILSLAVEIAIDFGLPLHPRLEREASEARGALAGRLVGVMLARLDPGLRPGRTGGHYDIERDI